MIYEPVDLMHISRTQIFKAHKSTMRRLSVDSSLQVPDDVRGKSSLTSRSDHVFGDHQIAYLSLLTKALASFPLHDEVSEPAHTNTVQVTMISSTEENILTKNGLYATIE
jgi:hypothetical protein